MLAGRLSQRQAYIHVAGVADIVETAAAKLKLVERYSGFGAPVDDPQRTCLRRAHRPGGAIPMNLQLAIGVVRGQGGGYRLFARPDQDRANGCHGGADGDPSRPPSRRSREQRGRSGHGRFWRRRERGSEWDQFEFRVARFGMHRAIRFAEEESGAHRLQGPVRPHYQGYLPVLREVLMVDLEIFIGEEDFAAGMRMVPAGRLQALRAQIRAFLIQQLAQAGMVVLRKREGGAQRVFASQRPLRRYM